jgi:hypothetical protein
MVLCSRFGKSRKIGASLILLLALGTLAEAQESEEVGICGGVIIDGWCVDNPSPEQLQQLKERDRIETERKEKDRRERDAKASERKRQVDVQVKIMGGEHRRAEAERFVQMREAAAAVRPKVIKPQTPDSQCKETRIADGFSSAYLGDVGAARAQVNQWASRCGNNGMSCGPITCKSMNTELLPNRPAVIRHSCTITATRPYRSCPGSTVSNQ